MLAQAAQSTSPWWGTAVIAGAFAIFGVLVSQLATFLNERRKDKRRLETDVRDACVRLLAVAKRIMDPASDQEPIDVSHQNWKELEESLIAVEFVAPKSIVKCAGDLRQALAGWVTKDREPLPEVEAQERNRVRWFAYTASRRDMVQELRKWLGLELL